MANVAVTYSFTGGTKAKASEVNTDFSDLVSWLNNRNTATSDWDDFSVVAAINIKATSNQIIFGSTTTTTLSLTAPASSRVVTVPDPGADASFVMTQGVQSISGAKTFAQATAGSSATVDIQNTDNSNGASNAKLTLETGGSSAGDPFVRFYNNVTNFSVGMDNSDSDKFKISNATALGTSDIFTLSTAGAAIFFKSLQNTFATAGTASTFDLTHSDNSNGASDSKITIETGGSSGGDPFLRFYNNVINWSVGMDNSDGDKFKISNSTALGTNDYLVVGAGASTILKGNTTSGGYLELKANGDFLTSQIAPLATNATAGFFYVPTVSGTPSGTPSSYTGQAAILFDTSASKLWVYNGSWKFVTAS